MQGNRGFEHRKPQPVIFVGFDRSGQGPHRLQDMSYKGFAFTLMARERANL